jgi:hypothetical protein
MECKLTETREIKFSNYLLVIFSRWNIISEHFSYFQQQIGMRPTSETGDANMTFHFIPYHWRCLHGNSSYCLFSFVAVKKCLLIAVAQIRHYSHSPTERSSVTRALRKAICQLFNRYHVTSVAEWCLFIRKISCYLRMNVPGAHGTAWYLQNIRKL